MFLCAALAIESAKTSGIGSNGNKELVTKSEGRASVSALASETKRGIAHLAAVCSDVQLICNPFVRQNYPRASLWTHS